MGNIDKKNDRKQFLKKTPSIVFVEKNTHKRKKQNETMEPENTNEK